MLVFIYPSGEDELLYRLKAGLFRLSKDSHTSEFIRFDVIIDGKAVRATFSRGTYNRAFTP